MFAAFTAGRSITADLFRREGVRGFWKGYSAAVLRAIPANGAGFLAYGAIQAIRLRPVSRLRPLFGFRCCLMLASFSAEVVRSAYERMDEDEGF